uniref:Uncharacterized protein n=1 Tax=Seriola dumerili TaxID=41447 RepID=A0A3B4VPM6_SERDU
METESGEKEKERVLTFGTPFINHYLKNADTSAHIPSKERSGKKTSEMTETNPPKSAKKPRWTSLEIGLITIVSLLFIVIVALIILFATQKTDEICTTADCTQSGKHPVFVCLCVLFTVSF